MGADENPPVEYFRDEVAKNLVLINQLSQFPEWIFYYKYEGNYANVDVF